MTKTASFDDIEGLEDHRPPASVQGTTPQGVCGNANRNLPVAWAFLLSHCGI